MATQSNLFLDGGPAPDLPIFSFLFLVEVLACFNFTVWNRSSRTKAVPRRPCGAAWMDPSSWPSKISTSSPSSSRTCSTSAVSGLWGCGRGGLPGTGAAQAVGPEVADMRSSTQRGTFATKDKRHTFQWTLRKACVQSSSCESVEFRRHLWPIFLCLW